MKGSGVYPHRKDLHSKVFWSCPQCNNYVGAHRDTHEPFGSIPTPALRRWRNTVHRAVDPIWRNGHMTRGQVYAEMSMRLGLRDFHVGNIGNIEDAQQALDAANQLWTEVNTGC